MTGAQLATTLKAPFDRDGFVLIRGFYNAADLAGLAADLDRYIKNTVPGLPPNDAFYEDKARPETLKQMHNMEKNEPAFDRLLKSDRFMGLASGLLGRPAVVRGVEWFNKPPRRGSATPPHQDGHYFMIEPNEALTFWLALDVVDESNGCLRYVPGSHRRGLRPHARTQTLGFSQGITDYGPADAAAEVRMIVQPGDLLVHHSLMVHRADANNSDRHRRALGLVYYSDLAKPDAGRLAEYQKSLMSDLAAKGKV